MPNPTHHAGTDPAERKAIHRRWVQHRTRFPGDSGYLDSWTEQQCGACRFWFPLAGNLGNDYGACANATSPHDRTVMFEHDGCDAFTPSGTWAIPEEM
ncbi:DUF3027 domain-containing protein [Kribbella sp. NPDC051770]|uniref:DUF3027 domain-containing protein n=1 Tax=Kribbella sp. NPDC051770 TaxID=3155413 RepID=UPI003436705A